MKLNKLYIVLSGVISLSLLQTGCGNDAETDEIAIEKSLMHENVVLSLYFISERTTNQHKC